MIFAAGDKLLFFGDSVTSCFRRSEAHRPYGNGSVNLVRALLLARYPELGLVVENRGRGGTGGTGSTGGTGGTGGAPKLADVAHRCHSWGKDFLLWGIDAG